MMPSGYLVHIWYGILDITHKRACRRDVPVRKYRAPSTSPWVVTTSPRSYTWTCTKGKNTTRIVRLMTAGMSPMWVPLLCPQVPQMLLSPPPVHLHFGQQGPYVAPRWPGNTFHLLHPCT